MLERAVRRIEKHLDRCGLLRQGALGLLEAVDRRDIRVVQRCQHLGLALESRDPFVIRSERGRQHLDRNIAIQLAVTRPVHIAHSTRADGRNDLVGSESRSGRQGHGMVSLGDGEQGRDQVLRRVSTPG